MERAEGAMELRVDLKMLSRGEAGLWGCHRGITEKQWLEEMVCNALRTQRGARVNFQHLGEVEH